MVECDDVLLSLVCDLGQFLRALAGPSRFLGLTYSAVGKSGVLAMESDEIVQHWHIIIIMIPVHKT